MVQELGADPVDQVPFEKYANAALSLLNPSSAARAVFAGVKNIERVDKLVQQIGRQMRRSLTEIDENIAIVDVKLTDNRASDQD